MEVFKFSRAKAEEVEVRRMYQISQPTPAVDEPQETIDFYCDFQLPTTASHYQHARAFEVFLIDSQTPPKCGAQCTQQQLQL